MCSDTAWNIPCCASISVEGSLLAVVAPLCQLGDDGTEGGSTESGAACVRGGACMEYSDSRLVAYWEGHRQFGSHDRPSTPSIPCLPKYKEIFVARHRHGSSKIKEDNCQTFRQLCSCHHQWLIQNQVRWGAGFKGGMSLSSLKTRPFLGTPVYLNKHLTCFCISH